MQKLRALVRPPALSFTRALSPHPEQKSIDLNKAILQHQDYCTALVEAGIEVVRLEPLEAFPDSTFIEDNAVILENKAYLTTMKAPTRRGESPLLEAELKKYLPVETLAPPIFLDGGDVLKTKDSIFIGQSKRTGYEAIQYFQKRLKQPVIPVEVKNALHLKTAATWLGGNRLLVNSMGCDVTSFKDYDCIEVETEDAYATNCLVIGKMIIMPAGYKRVEELLKNIGLNPRPVAMSEFEKANGGITCLSLIFPF